MSNKILLMLVFIFGIIGGLVEYNHNQGVTPIPQLEQPTQPQIPKQCPPKCDPPPSAPQQPPQRPQQCPGDG